MSKTEKVVKYQQGDVILTKIEKMSPTCNKSYKMTKENGYKVTLAFGEGTGHHHRFQYDELSTVVGYSYKWQDMPLCIKVSGSESVLQHEEHNPITVAPGLYQISQVNEFDHIGGAVRKVID